MRWAVVTAVALVHRIYLPDCRIRDDLGVTLLPLESPQDWYSAVRRSPEYRVDAGEFEMRMAGLTRLFAC